jgi:protein-S-isoprenylcysteine O-methyltransferase Ste14
MDDLFGKVQGKSKVDSRSADSINLGSLNVAARASMVNRTHRIVRERAGQMSSRRNRIRSLMAPLAISAVMLVILVTAVWTLLDEYELNPTGFVDSSDQYLVLALWFLPLSLALLGMVWWTRTRGRRSGNELIR